MGLDIYYYNAKSKESYSRYRDAVKRNDEFERRYYNAHRNDIDQAYNTWAKWNTETMDYMELNGRNEYEVDDDWLAEHPEPKYDFWQFATDEESKERDDLTNEITNAKADTGLSEEIESLYMRKQNWMVSFVQDIHPELLEVHPNYGKILKESEVVLSIEDVEELISRMEKILANKKECNVVATDERGMYSDAYKKFYNDLMEEQKEIAEKLLPTCGRFFFGSTEYDWRYYTNLMYYRMEFKKQLAYMKEHGTVLVYDESW